VARTTICVTGDGLLVRLVPVRKSWSGNVPVVEYAPQSVEAEIGLSSNFQRRFEIFSTISIQNFARIGLMTDELLSDKVVISGSSPFVRIVTFNTAIFSLLRSVTSPKDHQSERYGQAINAVGSRLPHMLLGFPRLLHFLGTSGQ